MLCATLPSGRPARMVCFSSGVPCGAWSSGQVEDDAEKSLLVVLGARTGSEVHSVSDGGVCAIVVVVVSDTGVFPVTNVI